MNKMLKLKSTQGQSKLEYASLYIIIFISLLIMAPYIFMGINAFFKDIDEQVGDSFTDPLLQAEGNVEIIDYDLPVVIPKQ